MQPRRSGTWICSEYDKGRCYWRHDLRCVIRNGARNFPSSGHANSWSTHPGSRRAVDHDGRREDAWFRVLFVDASRRGAGEWVLQRRNGEGGAPAYVRTGASAARGRHRPHILDVTPVCCKAHGAFDANQDAFIGVITRCIKHCRSSRSCVALERKNGSREQSHRASLVHRASRGGPWAGSKVL